MARQRGKKEQLVWELQRKKLNERFNLYTNYYRTASSNNFPPSFRSSFEIERFPRVGVEPRTNLLQQLQNFKKKTENPKSQKWAEQSLAHSDLFGRLLRPLRENRFSLLWHYEKPTFSLR